MAAYTVTTTPQVVAGAGGSWLLANGGAVNVFLSQPNNRYPEILVPGGQITLRPPAAVSAKTSTGTAALTVTPSEVTNSVVSGGTP